MSLPPKPRMNSTQLTLIGHLASGKPAVLVKPTKYTKGCVVTCNGNRSYLSTLESLVRKGVAERVPGTTNQWRLTELGRKWFLPDLDGKSDESLNARHVRLVRSMPLFGALGGLNG